MAVAFGSVGATSDGTTSLATAYPSGISAGDLLLQFIASKYNTSSHSTPTGSFTLLDAETAGFGSEFGSDRSTVVSSLFQKIASGSESGTTDTTITSGNVAQGFVVRVTRSGGSGFLVAATTARWTTDDTNPLSVTFDDDVGLQSGDYVLVFGGLNSDGPTGFSSVSLTAPGATIGSPTVRVFSQTPTGGDMSVYAVEFPVSSGASTGAATFEASKSSTAQGEGPVILVRVREDAGGGLTLSGISSTVSTGTITPQVDATRALAGEQLITAQGTITATQAAVQALSGEAATTAAGTLVPSTTVALAGSEVTTAAGTTSASGDVSQSLSGEASTVSAGTVGVTVSASRAITGQELTTAQGTIAATQAAVVDLTGEAVTSAAGTVGVTSSSSQALTGEAVTTTAGTVGVSTSASVALAGEASTTAIGTVTPSTGATEALSGSAVTTTAGTLGVTSSSAVTLAGEQIVVSSGTIAAATPDVTLALSGLTISALLSSIYLEGVWVPVEDENSNLWTAVNDSNANAWTVI